VLHGVDEAAPAEVWEVIGRVPVLAALRDLQVELLQGVQSLNNTIWTVRESRGGEKYVLRMANPIAVTHLGVRRDEEEAAARAAASVGLAPEVLYYDAEHGHMVTPWIEAVSWEPKDFRDPVQMSRVIDALRRLHAVIDLPGDPASVFRRIERLVESAHDFNLETPSQLAEYQRQLLDIEASRQSDGRVPGLNHNDFWANNLLDSGDRLWLVDWEFAGRGDGLYDLATTSMAGEFSPADDDRMLGEYAVNGLDRAALASMKWVVRFFEAAWSLVMDGLSPGTNDSPSTAFDYLAHSRRMFDSLSEADI
jgi:thiamine kinase-like enzyme